MGTIGEGIGTFGTEEGRPGRVNDSEAHNAALEGVRNNCGIVFVPNRPYVICVMTTYLTKERDGEEAITRISSVAYRMFDRMARASEYGRVVSPNDSGH
jgi:hypothetical protein